MGSTSVTKGLDPHAPMKDSGVQWLGEVPAHWQLCLLKRAFASVDYEALAKPHFPGLKPESEEERTGIKV